MADQKPKCPKCNSDMTKAEKAVKTCKADFENKTGKQQYRCKGCGHRTVNPNY